MQNAQGLARIREKLPRNELIIDLHEKLDYVIYPSAWLIRLELSQDTPCCASGMALLE